MHIFRRYHNELLFIKLYSQQPAVYDEFDLYSMNESTYTVLHPYKPKKHFTHYNNPSDIQIECQNNIEPIDCNSEDHPPTSKPIRRRYHCLSRSNSKTKRYVSSTTVYIPCLVCGDQSTGVHYGVNTCEGCKGFFRRSVKQKMSHQCHNMDNCEITPINRNFCQYCRFKKCLEVGMSRDASRMGRPPKQSYFKTINMMNSIKNSKIRKEKTTSDEKNKQISPTNRHDSVSSTTSNTIFPECLFQHRLVIFVPEIHQEILRKLTSMLIYQERLLTDIETNEIDHIAEVIINAHLEFSAYTFEKIQIKIEENPPVWADSTSDELNSDPASVWINWQLTFPFESNLKIFQSYTFLQEISQDDQTCLFRYGAFETILVSWFILFDIQPKLMLTPDCCAYMDRDFIKTIKTLGLFMLEIFDLGIKANHFRWTDSDIALFSALLLMNPGRPGLCDKEGVQQIETKLMQVLYRHLRRHHPDEPNIFLNVLQLIPSIQELNHIHLNAVRYIKRHELYMFHSLPDFHREIYEGLSS